MVMAKVMRKPTRMCAKKPQPDEETKSNMKVVVRVRPPNSVEGSDHTVRVMDEHVLLFDPNEESEAMDFMPRRRRRELQVLKRRARDLRFMFDRVFDHRTKNTDVFEHTTKAILDGVLNGYNCSVFAYGATGAGKTHTMLGSSTDPGVIFLTMVDLYKRIHECQHERLCDVAVSYLEVYNENIRDLLMPGSSLAVREDPQKGVCISKLTLHKPRSAEELLGMLEFGNNNRTQHPTDANAQSSRSHAVFQVFVRQKDRTAGLQANVKLAKMSLIDLAGSERATVTKNHGARFREGANINKSLLALGNCINALADNEDKSGHIPYRDSKLTRLLKDSLGGNCRTVMIAAVSPSRLSYEDTYNTLKYADRAKSIKSKLVRNVLNVDFHVGRYAKIVEDLRTEILELKGKLQSCGTGTLVNSQSSGSNMQDHEEVQRLRCTLKSVIKERLIIRKDIVDIQAAERDLLLKAYKKERNLERLQLLCVNGGRLDKSVHKTQKCLSATKTKQKHLSEKKRITDLRLVKNTQWLEQVQQDLNGLQAEQAVSQYLQVCQAAAQAELESSELKRQSYHLKKYAQAQEKDARNTERLLNTALSLLKKQFLLLKGAGLATLDLTEEYDAVVGTVEHSRELAWADQNSDKLNHSLISFHSIVAVTPTKDTIRVRQFDTPTDVTSGRVTDTRHLDTPTLHTAMTPHRVTDTASKISGELDTHETFPKSSAGRRIQHGSPGFKQTCVSLASEFDSVKTPSRVWKPCAVASKSASSDAETSFVRGTPRGADLNSITLLPVRPGLQNTAIHSSNAEDATSQRYSRTTTINSTITATSKTTGALLLGRGRSLAPVAKASSVLLAPARSLTPARDKISWSEDEGHQAALLHYCTELNMSGVEPVVTTPSASSGESDSTRHATLTPRDKLPFGTPLRELSLNSHKNIMDLHRVGLPSVFDRPDNIDKPVRIPAKTNKNMMPQRVINPMKENVQPKLERTCSVPCVNRINPSKVKKHMSGLRRTISSANVHSSRHCAPRSMRNEHGPKAEPNRPRWQ